MKISYFSKGRNESNKSLNESHTCEENSEIITETEAGNKGHFWDSKD